MKTTSGRGSLRFLTILLIAAMILAGIFCGLYLCREYTKVYRITNMGDMWSFVRINPGSSYFPFVEIDPMDFPHPPHPVPGDLLVAVDGRPATEENYFNTFSMKTPPGETIPIIFMHDGEMHSTDIVTRTVPPQLKFQIWLMFVLRVLIVTGLLFTGIWAMIKRTWSSPVRTLSLFCFTLAVHMALSSTIIGHLYASFQFPRELLILFGFIGISFAAFWLKLQLIFPERKPVYSEHRFLVNLLLFLPVIVLGFISMLTGGQAPALSVVIFHTLYLGLGLYLLLRNHRRAVSLVQKRQTHLVFLGSVSGILVYVLYNWFMYSLRWSQLQIPITGRMIMANAVFLLMLPVPVFIVYAFRKYNLLEVEGKLKRGSRMLAVNMILLVLFFGFLYFFGKEVVSALGIDSQTPTLVLGMGMAISLMPAQRKLRSIMENRIYPEKRELRILLKEYLAGSSRGMNEEMFWNELERKLARSLSVKAVHPVLRTAEEDYRFRSGEPAPFLPSDPLMGYLSRREGPVMLDEILESGVLPLTPRQEEWLQNVNCALVLPLSVKSGLIGFLAVEGKVSGDDFTGEEMLLLKSFSVRIALVAENLHLFSEKLERQKLSEQLRMGRNIQRGLLPDELPSVPGYGVAGMIEFCLDVAGDYYDVVKLDNGDLLLAIADVSGKGVGAALIKANLQASLRTTCQLGTPPAVAAERINSLIFANTPREMFISFFLACLNPETGVISYVNAGHNPPILLKSSGGFIRLVRGGTLLGIKQDSRYDQGELRLKPDDILLAFTDGVTESMNPLGEEFGEARLEEILSRCGELEPAEILKLIAEKVEEFHGSEDFDDDLTMLLLHRNR